jgi:hypothetical protein
MRGQPIQAREKMTMTKIISLVLALAVVSVLMIASVDTASAQGKKGSPISFSTFLLVTGFESIDTNTKSGWTTIKGETLQGPAPLDVDGLDALDGFYISAEQSSKEKFSTPDIFSATVSEGKSKGKFFLTNPATGDQVIGKYDLKLSSSVDCHILGKGKWNSKGSTSIIHGKGEISVCTNFVAAHGTFLTTVSMTGSAVLLD